MNNKQEMMMAEIDDFLTYAHQKNYAQADKVFKDLISDKMKMR